MVSKRPVPAGAVIFILLAFTASTVGQRRAKPVAKPAAAAIPVVKQIGDEDLRALIKPDGKPLLINFWATWCVPCREEFPDLVVLDKEFRGKIDFITISLDDLAEIKRDVPKFLNQMGAKMPAYLLKTADENNAIAIVTREWKGGLPFSILYAPTGETAYFRQGKIDPATVRQKINDQLAVK